MHTRAISGLLVLLIGLGAISGASARDAPASVGLRAGAATCDITPPVGHPLWGYAARKDQPSTAVRDPLHARALVLAVNDDRLAFVSLDLGRPPPRAAVAALRARLAKAGVQHFFLVASHTHHGPVLELDEWPTPENSYVRELERKLGDLILKANGDLRPARLGIAAKEVPFNRNRHSKRPDRPVDRELIVLRVEDEAGKPIAHAVNFAAHVTMLPAKDRQLSADWPGAMARAIEKETAAPCLFLQGAAGDLSPDPARGPTPDAFGTALAGEALKLASAIRCAPPKKNDLPAREEELKFTPRIDLKNPFLHATMSAAFFPGLIAFYEREYRDGVRPHLTVALLDGRIGIVGVSGEFFCGHSLSLKRRARLDHVLFLGYCNDYQQYFPTIEAAAEGGYGTEPWISPAEFGAGERVVDRALVHLFQMRGRLK